MFEKVLPKDAKNALASISAKNILPQKTYLAGGTALALQLGHRKSFDFDFFTPANFQSERLALKMKRAFKNFELDQLAWGTILGYLGKTRFSLFIYESPLLFPAQEFAGAVLADVRDIAAMKIAAISDRGTKRDFIDLYTIVASRNIISLAECLNLYDKKFKALDQNKTHILKSLVYFNDAEADLMPKMLERVGWPEVKKFFQKEITALSRKLF